MPTSNKPTNTDPPLSEIELHRIAPPREIERLSGCSWDTNKRNHPEWVVQISPRRTGMRVGHALRLLK
jgi:hypothetical protein